MISILTLFFIFTRIVSNPIANAIQKKISYNISSVSINFYTYLILSIIGIGIIFKNLHFNYLHTEFIFWGFLAGLLCAAGNICMIKAINIGELSILGPINSYKCIIGLIASVILLNEIPQIYAIIGILLIIFGSRIIFSTTKEGFSAKLLKRKDIQLRFLALLLTGTEAAILKKIIILSSGEICFALWCISGLFWSCLIMILSKKTFKIDKTEIYYQLILISIFLGIMQYSTNYIFQRINVGYALALFQLSSIVTVFLGYKIFNEKSLIKKLTGSLIMISGAGIIILIH